LVPLEVYFKNGKVKIELGIAKVRSSMTRERILPKGML